MPLVSVLSGVAPAAALRAPRCLFRGVLHRRRCGSSLQGSDVRLFRFCFCVHVGLCWPVAAWVFPFAELRLLSVERLLFWSAGSGFSACSSWVLERWLHSCADAQLLHGLWDLPGPGTEPVSSSLAGGVFTTELPGSPGVCLLKDTVCNHSWPALLPAGVRTRSPAILRSDRQCSSANPITRVTSGCFCG